jgi:hypothetical protein
MRLQSLSCFAVAAVMAASGQAALASPTMDTAAKAAPESRIQLAQDRPGSGMGAPGGAQPSAPAPSDRGGGAAAPAPAPAPSPAPAARGGGGERSGGAVRGGGMRSGDGGGPAVGAPAQRGEFRGGDRSNRQFRGGDRGDRQFRGAGFDRRDGYRGHRDRGWRYRDGRRSGVFIYPGRSWCHRHHSGYRVLRHCHPYSYRWHRHGRWR